MGNTVIRVESISKKYYIGRKQEKSGTLRDALTDMVTSPFRKAGKLLRGQATGAAGLDEIIWALREVSFEVKQGEIIGIIGSNGSGKSTLLKILSRITEPSEGFAEINGRVGSLLEVGTGFHNELTGRENVFLNGAILGMKNVEIRSKFDEIVAFAEIDKFVDTPVKHYSSGMYLRLAFAVAAHLDPEILIVDEVLAVGDAAFQKKCLNKMQDVEQEGRTVLFVSHNMTAIAGLCKRAILFKEGRLSLDGQPHQVVNSYLNAGLKTNSECVWNDMEKAPGGDIVCLWAVRVKAENNQVEETFDISRPVGIEMEYEVLKPGYVLSPYFDFYNEEGVHLFASADLDPAWRHRPRPSGRYTSTVRIPGNLLSEATVFVKAGLATLDPIIYQFNVPDVVSFRVFDNFTGDSARGDWTGKWGGAVRPILQWNTQCMLNKDKAIMTLSQE